MAKTSLIVKTKKRKKRLQQELSRSKKPSFSTRVYNRCTLCGRPHGYMRKFKMCRICFREYAKKGLIPGIKKCSW